MFRTALRHLRRQPWVDKLPATQLLARGEDSTMRHAQLARLLLLLSVTLAVPSRAAAAANRYVLASVVKSGVPGPHRMAMAPDGNHVYVAARRAHGVTAEDLVVLARDPATGTLGDAQLFVEDGFQRYERLLVTSGQLYATSGGFQGGLQVHTRDPPLRGPSPCSRHTSTGREVSTGSAASPLGWRSAPTGPSCTWPTERER